MKLIVSIFAVVTCFFVDAGCSNQPKPFTEKKLVIASKETVKIPELDLSITNDGCGRKWMVEGDKPGYEIPYCGLLIKQKDSAIQGGGDFMPVYIGNVEITVEKMNPWGAEEDSVPPGGCRVLVRKLQRH